MIDIRAKDYVVVDGQLYFAVISDDVEQGRILTWLRYIKDREGMRKLNTSAAAAIIRQQRPELLFHSELADIDLHGIPFADIKQVLKPQQAAAQLLELADPDDKQADAIRVLELLIQHGIDKQRLGITGSLLLEAQNTNSDVDLVIYGRAIFFKARAIIARLIETGELKALQNSDWRHVYARRGCSINFNEYCLHERRKLNKCICGSSKVDINMIPDQEERVGANGTYIKCGHKILTACVVDDRYAYDFPARFIIDDDAIKEIVVYTATYTGQAANGEVIEASGMLEKDTSGKKRLVVGTSREAEGEYLKVIRPGEI